jgi:phosphoribosyl-ATP pyrophosphohydrolase/phosphoribosyl-AMP cyclohydrolase
MSEVASLQGRIEPADISRLDFAKSGGLMPAIVQHCDTRAVLMLGYMTPEALRATLLRRRVVFFSRSRRRLWEKGETSGNALDLVAVRADCDRDALLVSARPAGPACHLGTASCFGEESENRPDGLAFLAELERVIARRIAERPAGSYTARLYAEGATRLAQKVGEEGLEVALAAVTEADEKLLGESADLVFHLLLLLKSRGLTLERVVDELKCRRADRG